MQTRMQQDTNKNTTKHKQERNKTQTRTQQDTNKNANNRIKHELETNYKEKKIKIG